MKGTKPNLQQDPNAVKAVPKPPAWLSKEAKSEWRRIMPLLVERRILTEADMGGVENYCVAIGQVRATERIIQTTDGGVYKSEHGPKKHPAVAIQADAMTRARQLASELGLTPVSLTITVLR